MNVAGLSILDSSMNLDEKFSKKILVLYSYEYTETSLYTYAFIHMYTHTYTYIHMFTYMYIDMHIRVSLHL